MHADVLLHQSCDTVTNQHYSKQLFEELFYCDLQVCRLSDEALKQQTQVAETTFLHFDALAKQKASAVQQNQAAIREKEHILRQLLRSNSPPTLDEFDVDEQTRHIQEQNERLMATMDEQDGNLAQAKQEADSAWEKAQRHSTQWDTAVVCPCIHICRSVTLSRRLCVYQ